jgi:hypothetical protein
MPPFPGVNQTFSGPFVPEPYDNSAFVTRLADLINRRAEVAAQGALQRGASRAQMWQSAGQAVMQTLAQLAQQRELTKQRAVAAEQQAIENAFKNRQIATQEAAERNAAARAAADEQWRRDQFRDTRATKLAENMRPGDVMTPENYARDIQNTSAAPMYAFQAAEAERLPARGISDNMPLAGVRALNPDNEALGGVIGSTVSSDIAARPDRYERLPSWQEQVQADQLALAQYTAQQNAANRDADNRRADEAARALQDYRTRQIEQRNEQMALTREGLELRRQALGVGMSNKQMSNALQLANSLKAHPAYADMSDIHTGWMGVQAGLKQANGFGDVTAINAFQRMVDPGATVREGDVALLQSAASFKDKLLSTYPLEKLRTGAKLPEAVREQMRQVAEHLYRVRAQNYNDTVGNQYRKLAEAAQVPFELIGSEFVVTPSASAKGKSFWDQ